MTKMFCDLPDEQRMAYLDAIDAAGGHVAGYYGPFVQVALPNPSAPFFTAMTKAGLVLDEKSLHHFPLGTDSPPVTLRHDGRYPGSAGFWLYGNFSRMTGDTPMSEKLEAMSQRVSRDPWFLGHALAAYQRRFGLTDAALADELGCTEVAVLVSLRLCRRPGGAAPDRSVEEDVVEIARRFGIDSTALRRVVTAVR